MTIRHDAALALRGGMSVKQMPISASLKVVGAEAALRCGLFYLGSLGVVGK